MHAQQLLSQLDPLGIEEAAGWIEAALAEAAALRQHDRQLDPISDDCGVLATARSLHDAWRRWVEDAEALFKRVPSRGVPRRDELDHAIARARAILKLTPEMTLQRHEQIRRGEFKTLEEVRRELGLKARR